MILTLAWIALAVVGIMSQVLLRRRARSGAVLADPQSIPAAVARLRARVALMRLISFSAALVLGVFAAVAYRQVPLLRIDPISVVLVLILADWVATGLTDMHGWHRIDQAVVRQRGRASP